MYKEPPAKSLRVLIVEDEPFVALDLEDLFTSLGHQVVAIAAGLAEAKELVNKGEIDFVTLDVNLRGEASYPVADELLSGGIPFVFATAYEARATGKYAGVDVVSKPIDRLTLMEAMDRSIKCER